MRKKLTVSVFLVTISLFVHAQQPSAEPVPEKLVPRELSIPSSPLFDLMGASPSLVAKSASIKDFKVDWSFRSWRINPNLAIQSQPVWELFYNRKAIDKYQRASRLARMLASTDLSVGTIQNELSERRIGGAVKWNIYQQHDPLLERNMYDDVQQQFQEEYVLLVAKERDLMKQLDSLTHPRDIAAVRALLKENDALLSTFYGRRNTAIQERAKELAGRHWNAAFVDVAFGKIYTYATDSAGSLSKLRLNRNTGNGAWLNFGFGMGKRGMLTGLVRTTFYEEELQFLLRDESTGVEESRSAIAANRLITLGLSFRYGGPVYNFFAEFVREGKTLKTPVQALSDVFTAPGGTAVVQSSVNWDIVHPYLITLGGDWRVGRNIVLNYGVRMVFDNQFKSRQVIPVANISCMMR